MPSNYLWATRGAGYSFADLRTPILRNRRLELSDVPLIRKKVLSQYRTRSVFVSRAPRDVPLSPTEWLMHKNPRLYDRHCREICERCLYRRDLRPGTHAEVMGYLVEKALMSPISERAAALYSELYAELFNESGDRLDEPWTDSNRVMLADVQRYIGRTRPQHTASR